MITLLTIILVSFFLKSKNFLLTLLNFELFILVTYIILVFSHSNNFFSWAFPLYYLVFGVCESCLGLGILIYMVRGLGSDSLKNLILLN